MILETVISHARQTELIQMAEEGCPVTAINSTIVETMMGFRDMSNDLRKKAIYDRDLVITAARRRQLFDLAIAGFYASAIRETMREVIAGAKSGVPTPPVTREGEDKPVELTKEFSLCG